MDKTINIRKETQEDYAWVIELTEKAFETGHIKGDIVKIGNLDNFVEIIKILN